MVSLRKKKHPIDVIFLQDSSVRQKELTEGARAMRWRGHKIKVEGIEDESIDSVIEALERRRKTRFFRHKSNNWLPTDIIMDPVPGGAEKIAQWIETNCPGAPLPRFSFCSLGLDHSIRAAQSTRLNDPRILADAIDPNEFAWLKPGRKDPDAMPFSTTFRRLLNDQLGTNIAMDCSGSPAMADYEKRLRELDTFAEWTKGNLSSEELARRMRPFLEEFTGSLHGKGTTPSPAQGLSGLRKDVSFYSATGQAQKGTVIFSPEEAEHTQDPILVMRGYDPAIVPLMARGQLAGIIVTSPYMASHLQQICEAYGVPGLFGVAPDKSQTRMNEFNEEARPQGSPFFEESESVPIATQDDVKARLYRGQTILMSLDGDGLVLDPPATVRTPRTERQNLGMDAKFGLKTMMKCFAQYFGDKDERPHRVKANIGAFDPRQPEAVGGIGLVRTEQIVAQDENLRLCCAYILMGEEGPYETFNANIGKAYQPITSKLKDGPVKIRLFDFTPGEILTKEEQREFLKIHPKLDIHGGEALAAWPRLYREQVRSIFEALQHSPDRRNPLEIMMPAVRTEQDVLAIKSVVDEEAARAGIPPGTGYSFGVMIETLDACRNIESIAKHCDFISYGTNDLTAQHTGMGRDDAKAHAAFAGRNGYNPFKTMMPEVFSLVAGTLSRARQMNPGLKADVCGAQAANVDTALALFKVGIDDISVAPTPANLWGLPVALNYRLYDDRQSKITANPGVNVAAIRLQPY